ncbi:MAG: hypothetical protein IKO10_05780 [Lachnospiraceae bacterium]|nr:hypothetical protein [Lachnospiraceae bacterium]
MDLYQLVRDLIEEAHKQKQLEMVDKLIEIKKAISELDDENEQLKKKLEIHDTIERHMDGNYVTLKNENPKIRYCSTCWGNDNKLIQLSENSERDPSLPQCPICFNNWLWARNGGK